MRDGDELKGDAAAAAPLSSPLRCREVGEANAMSRQWRGWQRQLEHAGLAARNAKLFQRGGVYYGPEFRNISGHPLHWKVVLDLRQGVAEKITTRVRFEQFTCRPRQRVRRFAASMQFILFKPLVLQQVCSFL